MLRSKITPETVPYHTVSESISIFLVYDQFYAETFFAAHLLLHPILTLATLLFHTLRCTSLAENKQSRIFSIFPLRSRNTSLVYVSLVFMKLSSIQNLNGSRSFEKGKDFAQQMRRQKENLSQKTQPLTLELLHNLDSWFLKPCCL